MFVTPVSSLSTTLLNLVKLALISQVMNLFFTGVPVIPNSRPFVCISPAFFTTEVIPEVFDTGTGKIRSVDFCLYTVASIYKRFLKRLSFSITLFFITGNNSVRFTEPVKEGNKYCQLSGLKVDDQSLLSVPSKVAILLYRTVRSPYSPTSLVLVEPTAGVAIVVVLAMFSKSLIIIPLPVVVKFLVKD